MFATKNFLRCLSKGGHVISDSNVCFPASLRRTSLCISNNIHTCSQWNFGHNSSHIIRNRIFLQTMAMSSQSCCTERMGSSLLCMSHRYLSGSQVLFSFSRSFGVKHHTLIGKVDRHNGIHMDLGQLNISMDTTDFEDLLKASMEHWSIENHTAAWFKVPISHSHFIAVAAKHGFVFHHAEGNCAMLCQWLQPTESKLPQFSTHQLGVAGCVVREETGEVLVVRDKNRPYTLWKFPGGVAELGEDIGETAERETLEETGVHSKFEGIMLFRQQHDHPGAFGRSDLFFICHMTPLTFDLHPCEDEIEACQWMTLDEVAATMQTSAITQRTIHLVRLGLRHGFHRVEMPAEQFQSVYKGHRFKMYNRYLGDDGGVSADYLHSMVSLDEQKHG